MKKVIITVLMLFVVLGGLFAAEGKQAQVKIIAEVGGSSTFGFTQNQYTDVSNDIADDPVTGNKITADENEIVFYASAKTNKNSGITMKIKATGLTRVVDNSYTNDVVTLTINSIDFTKAASSTIESGGVTDSIDTTTITFNETVDSVANLSGYRAVTNRLSISADLSGATAGDYTAFVTLIADAQ